MTPREPGRASKNEQSRSGYMVMQRFLITFFGGPMLTRRLISVDKLNTVSYRRTS